MQLFSDLLMQIAGYPGAIHLGSTDEGPVEVMSTVDRIRCVVNQLGSVSGPAQGLGKSLGIVPKRFPEVERLTISVRHHISSMGNGRETGAKGRIESPGFCGQTIDVKGSDPVVFIITQSINLANEKETKLRKPVKHCFDRRKKQSDLTVGAKQHRRVR